MTAGKEGAVDVLAVIAEWANDTSCPLDEANRRAAVYAAVAELIQFADNAERIIRNCVNSGEIGVAAMTAGKEVAVDVGRVLEQTDVALATAGLSENDILRREFNEGRAAVDELIEADKEYDEARSRFRQCSSVAHRMRLKRAEDRRAIALARVQGGQR